jgi:two-component system response regulator NreC
MKLKILCIEDHPAMVEGYKSILAFSKINLHLEYTIAENCETAYNEINNNIYDVVFLDLIIPSFPLMGINSGEDIAILLRKRMPKCKIVILTSHTEKFIIYSIIKKIQPEGFLVKSDFSAEELIESIESIINGQIVYTDTVKKSLIDIKNRDIYLDSYNRKILVLLNQGIKTKSLPQYLNLSLSAIDKRKVYIKDFLGIEKGGDEDILREAKKKGFI